jgi:hypothetical protein
MLRLAENRTPDRGISMGGASCRFSTLSACVEAEFDGHEEEAQGCATRPLVYFVLVFTTGLRDGLYPDVALGKGRVSVRVSQSVIRRVRTYGCVSSFQFDSRSRGEARGCHGWIE